MQNINYYHNDSKIKLANKLKLANKKLKRLEQRAVCLKYRQCYNNIPKMYRPKQNHIKIENKIESSEATKIVFAENLPECRRRAVA